MKKKLPILLTLILTVVLSVIGLTACGGVKFKVNFMVDGEVYATIDTSGNEIIEMPEDPIKEGFEFDGWFWDKDTWQQPFTANSLLDAPLSSNMKVYAKWKRQYTLTIVYGNGQADKVITQVYGTAINYQLPTELERKGYTFNGWSEPVPTTMPAENKTITASWQINKYTLTIVYGNSQADKVITQDYGTTIESISNPTKSYYTFMGWSESIPSTMPAENKTITASWQINKYTLTIVYGNGQANKVITQDYGTTIENISNPTRTDYIFMGWSESIPTTMPGENKTISASWLGYLEIFTVSGGAIIGLTTHGKTLTEIVIPSTINGTAITSIGEKAFWKCDSLERIEIGSGISSIGERAFDGCNNLESITVDSNNANYKDIDGNLYSKDGTILIQYTIGKTATTFEIPNSVTSIGSYAFYICYGLESIVIPNSVTSIGSYAFFSCGSLTNIEIPNSVTNIGDSAFVSCRSLTSITVDSNNANYKDIDGNLCSKDGTILIQYAIGKTATTFEIPNSVISIGDRAFELCDGLENIEIPNSVISIGALAFRGCSSLTSIEIPNSVTSIGVSAFEMCDGLESVLIPNSVTSIGSYAFFYCRGLTNIVIPNSVTSIGKSAFWACDNLTIYCEASSKPSGWNSDWNPDNRPVVWGHTIEE